ncbi:dethiobiotin synthase [Kaarinaea lacus]
MKGYFVTGTDTGVGKTRISLALMHALQAQGKSVAGMKPVSAGCVRAEDGLRNDDAVQIQKAASVEIPYEIVNPYAYEPPIAPHIAAQTVGDHIAMEQILACYQQIASKADIVIVEGAGGWLVPINDKETLADIAIQLDLPVILVVGMRLGCLNHALLSVESIQRKGLKLCGWIANDITPAMEKSTENVASLQQRITAPLLGILPYNPAATYSQLKQHLDLSSLKN